ncbi:MAG: Fic family protein [Candidatus Aenigmarchaeota archaeon]|nr:Fic family protein [Candidatus Aenigmarchaeota archaeon]
MFFDKFIKKENKNYFENKDIIYLSVHYISVLRNLIIKMYEQSDDPISKGYMSKSNLNYTMEYVKEMYNDSENKKEKLRKKAAFIFYNITSKHPFSDGNKRTAIIACNSFLEYNGYTIGNLPFNESYKFITSVAKCNKTELDCQNFIQKHISKLVVSEELKKEIIKMQQDLNKNEE